MRKQSVFSQTTKWHTSVCRRYQLFIDKIRRSMSEVSLSVFI